MARFHTRKATIFAALNLFNLSVTVSVPILLDWATIAEMPQYWGFLAAIIVSAATGMSSTDYAPRKFLPCVGAVMLSFAIGIVVALSAYEGASVPWQNIVDWTGMLLTRGLAFIQVPFVAGYLEYRAAVRLLSDKNTTKKH